MLEPTNISEIADVVRQEDVVIPVGSGSKSALSKNPNLSMLRLKGITEYDPSEFTITALAGTPLKEIQKVLSENHQYLPFDPPLAEKGATIGGTVAAGLSGPGAYRFGPIRDF